MITSILNFGLPTFFLAVGKAVPWSKSLDAEVKAGLQEFLKVLRPILTGLTGFGLAGGNSAKPLLVAFANTAVTTLIKAVPKVMEAIATVITAEELLDAVPFAGWVAEAIAAAADVVLLVETTVEVLASYPTIELDINKVMDVKLTVNPDPKSAGGKQWPSQSDHWQATLQYSDGTTYQKTGHLDPVTTTGPIAVTFPSVPAGGTLKAIFAVYSAAPADWLCGKGESDSLQCARRWRRDGDPGRVGPLLALHPVPRPAHGEHPVPVQGQARLRWHSPLERAPGRTRAHRDRSARQVPDREPPCPARWDHVRPDHRCTRLCLAGFRPESARSRRGRRAPVRVPEHLGHHRQGPGVAVSQLRLRPAALLGVRPARLEDRDRAELLLRPTWQRQPSPPGGPRRHHSVLDDPGQSFGRFNEPMDSLAIHPAGYVVGISTANHKMEVLTLSSKWIKDADVPAAVIKGGLGCRPGLRHPLAVVTTLDGRILVLDQLYAFDSKTTFPARMSAGRVRQPRTLLCGEVSRDQAQDRGVDRHLP